MRRMSATVPVVLVAGGILLVVLWKAATLLNWNPHERFLSGRVAGRRTQPAPRSVAVRQRRRDKPPRRRSAGIRAVAVEPLRSCGHSLGGDRLRRGDCTAERRAIPSLPGEHRAALRSWSVEIGERARSRGVEEGLGRRVIVLSVKIV